MIKIKLIPMVAVISLSIAHVAMASQFEGLVGQGANFYIGANVGYAMVGWKSENEALDTSYTINNKNGLTYGFDVGYMLNQNFGAELDYDFYADQKVDYLGTEVAKIEKQNYPSLLAVLNMPINQQWNAFAKLGAVYLTPSIVYVTDSLPGSATYNVWAPEFVLGGGDNIMPNLVVNSQVKYIPRQKQLYTATWDPSGDDISTPSYTAFTVGVSYKF